MPGASGRMRSTSRSASRGTATASASIFRCRHEHNMSIASANDEPLLIAESLTKRYGRQLACRDVSFELYEGEVIAVVGESGSGKSTLLQLLCAQLEANAGRVLYRMRDGI